MEMRRYKEMTRRKALAVSGGAISLATALGVTGTAKAAIIQSVQGGGGAAGGGIVTTAAGEAQFSIFASRLMLEGVDDPVIFGEFAWLDPSGAKLESTAVTNYGPVDGEADNIRELSGTLTMNDAEHAFTVRIVDAGGLGDEADTLTLTVFAAGVMATPVVAGSAEAVLTAEGPITVGEVRIVDFTF